MNTDLTTKLVACGVIPTPQRVAIFASLAGRCDHPSVDVVFRELRSRLPTLSKTTVYSTMQLLARKQLIGCVHLNGVEVRYDGNAGLHAHFHCRSCGRVYDVPVRKSQRRPFAAVPEDFEIDSEELSYYGICSVCKNRENKKTKGKRK